MRVVYRYIVLLTICFSGYINAATINEIRFGKTTRSSRIVFESDTRLRVNKIWGSKNLILEILDIDRKPSNDVISLPALSIILKIEWSTDEHILKIVLPVKQQDFTRDFRLAAKGSLPERLVLDWRADNNGSIDSDGTSRSKSLSAIVVPAVKTATLATPTTPTTPLVVSPKFLSSTVSQEPKTLKINIKNALMDRNYRLAISLLNKLLKEGSAEQKAFSLEYLGVARERNNQQAFAKQYYQRFLKEHPESDNVPRVKQRLAALIGVQNMAKRRRLKKGKRRSGRRQSAIRGSIGTDYRNSILVNDIGESRQTLSLLGLDADLRGAYDFGGSELDFRFSGSHFEDLTSDGGSTNDRIRYLNVGWTSKDEEYQFDIGRQRSRGKGVFGRFDGAVIGYAFNDTNKINLTLGAPVSSSKVLKLDPDRRFVSLNYEWDEMITDVDVSVFFLNQAIGNLTDRRAIGGEIKYANSGTSVFGLIDYDIFYSELNAVLISASHTTKGKTRYFGSYNQRKSPYISTRNALIGQSSDSIDELQNTLITDDEILDLAADRTLESQTATFQISTPINKTFDISGSVTQLSISGAPSSGGVAEIIKPGNQFYFNSYVTASKLYSGADSSQLGYRMSKLSTSDVNSIYVTSRYRWKNSFSLGMKLRYDARKNDNGGGQQNISPSLRLQYQNKSQYFYADIGAILFTNQVVGLSDIKTDIYFSYIGYRYFF